MRGWPNEAAECGTGPRLRRARTAIPGQSTSGSRAVAF